MYLTGNKNYSFNVQSRCCYISMKQICQRAYNSAGFKPSHTTCISGQDIYTFGKEVSFQKLRRGWYLVITQSDSYVCNWHSRCYGYGDEICFLLSNMEINIKFCKLFWLTEWYLASTQSGLSSVYRIGM